MNIMQTAVLAAVAAMSVGPLSAFAQDTRKDTTNQGYLVDSFGNNITTSSTTGLCWRDMEWTPARAKEPCDYVPKPVAAAPAATPAPAPQPRAADVVPRAPLAAAPALAPVPVLPQKMSFSADALFAFDKSTLKPEGMVMLDDLVRQLQGVSFDRIVATGHTDRIGSNAYNQKLSERRAHTVKDYLVAKNVQAARVEAVGKGEMEPETKLDTCKGSKGAKLIACLQPDRRVDVEMHGTKSASAR